MNMLEKIQLQLENLSKSERKVAEVILASPTTAMHSSIALPASGNRRLTASAIDWMPTAFQILNLPLAQSLAKGSPDVSHNVEQDDSVESYSSKIFESAMTGLDRVKQSLDVDAVNRAIDLLTHSKKIAFFGLGASAAVAHDAINEFFASMCRLSIQMIL